jgi:16S rRNA processing protein RimM
VASEIEKENDWVMVGRIRRAWGSQGHVIVDVLSDTADRFAQGETLFIDGRPVTIESARPSKKAMVLKLVEVDSPEAAEALRGNTLTIPPSSLPSLPEDTYYHYHLIGMEVYTREGRPLGVIADILITGSNDVYVVRKGTKDLLVPALPDVILDVDVSKGRMIVELLPGLEP